MQFYVVHSLQVEGQDELLRASAQLTHVKKLLHVVELGCNRLPTTVRISNPSVRPNSSTLLLYNHTSNSLISHLVNDGVIIRSVARRLVLLSSEQRLTNKLQEKSLYHVPVVCWLAVNIQQSIVNIPSCLFFPHIYIYSRRRQSRE